MMHAGVVLTVAGAEVGRDEHIRVSWPDGPARTIVAGDLLNVMADDAGWEGLGQLVHDCGPAEVTNRELRQLREAAGAHGLDGGEPR